MSSLQGTDREQYGRPNLLIDCSSAAPETGGNMGLCLGVMEHFSGCSHFNMRAICNPNLVPQLSERARTMVLATTERPGRGPLSFLRWHRKLRQSLDAHAADLLFIPYGPIYAEVPVPTLQGFAEPWSARDNARRWLKESLYERLGNWIRRRVKSFYYAKSTYLWAETETGRQDVLKALPQFSVGRVSIVFNNVPIGLAATKFSPKSSAAPNRPFIYFYPAAPYPHKNHMNLLTAWRELGKEGFELWITVRADTAHARNICALAAQIPGVRNFGPVTQQDLPRFYADADAVVMPSLAEVFSATYLEAFHARRPLVAADLPFAREIAGKAALYFNPNDATSLAGCIRRLAHDRELRSMLIGHGIERLAEFPSFTDKMDRLVEIISDILKDPKS